MSVNYFLIYINQYEYAYISEGKSRGREKGDPCWNQEPENSAGLWRTPCSAWGAVLLGSGLSPTPLTEPLQTGTLRDAPGALTAHSVTIISGLIFPSIQHNTSHTNTNTLYIYLYRYIYIHNRTVNIDAFTPKHSLRTHKLTYSLTHTNNIAHNGMFTDTHTHTHTHTHTGTLSCIDYVFFSYLNSFHHTGQRATVVDSVCLCFSFCLRVSPRSV